ncbi:MAG: carbohydrate ABC transporter permease [Alphaproteobacteria bacterium]|jgi:multiple sugar transport system permease protein|nr:carbohydrate ABC transporter permease [Alphaproteobacteria bacterium]
MRSRTATSRVLLYLANIVTIFFLLFPIFAVVQGSVMSEKVLHSDITAVVPPSFTMENFLLILTQGEHRAETETSITSTYMPDNIRAFYRAFANSTIIALSVTAITLLLGASSAYTIARLRFRWTLWFLQANLVARFVPIIALMIPLFVLGRETNMLNSLTGVILAEVGFLLPYAILILAPYFQSFPSELEDAARVDGCTRFSAFVRVILPLSAPGLAACGVIMFIVSWHELLIPLVVNSKLEYMTLPMVLSSLVSDTNILFNVMMALALLTLLPTLVLVLVLQKYVVQGLATGAVKG